MKISMIVYSKTGHTEFAARKVCERLRGGGHEVNFKKIEQIHTVDFNVDALLLCSPIHGGEPARPMKGFLSENVERFKGKKAAVLMTGGMWKSFRDVGVRQFKRMCVDTGLEVLGGASVGWTGRLKRIKRICDAAEALANCLD